MDRNEKVVFMTTIPIPDKPIPLDLYSPEVYFNRELSWLSFNERVLGEALHDSVPLLERLKFLTIVSFPDPTAAVTSLSVFEQVSSRSSVGRARPW